MKRLITIVRVLLLLLLITPLAAVAAPQQQYQGEVTSPLPNAVLRGQVVVNGTANHPEFWKYEVRVAPGLNPTISDEEWYRITVQEQPIINGQLAVWNTTTLPDGVYTLRLRVVRNDGNWQDFDIRPLNVANSAPPTSTQPQPTSVTELESTPTPSESEGTPATPEEGSNPLATPPSTLPTLEPSDVTRTPIVIDQPTIIVPTATVEGATGGEPIAVVPSPGSDSISAFLPDFSEGGMDLSSLTGACFTGAAIAIGVFLLVGLLFLMKILLRTFR